MKSHGISIGISTLSTFDVDQLAIIKVKVKVMHMLMMNILEMVTYRVKITIAIN